MTKEYSSFGLALLGHMCLLGFLFIQIRLPAKTVVTAPVLFDLKDLEITSETQIPLPKKSPVAVKKTLEAMPDVKPPIEKEEQVPIPSDSQEDAVTMEKQTETPMIKPKAKPKPPLLKSEMSEKSVKTQSMKTLLASVEKISAQIGKEEKKENFQNTQNEAPKITVSELAFIEASIRKHWNLDAGVSGVDKMLIEVKVFLDVSGNVYDVQFLDTNRYGKDAAYTSVADSARRAIFICDKLGEDSPFKKLAQKHIGTYSEWKELVLKFTPFKGGR